MNRNAPPQYLDSTFILKFFLRSFCFCFHLTQMKDLTPQDNLNNCTFAG